MATKKNVYLRDAEEDATIVKKYDNTPLQKGWYGFYY